mmetsp:Transcript_92509/g.169782  ORF Transcript_92509/g.169782 Transcript_92509/m.169782 type:complete len:452 (+) Transcript_92509:52-1407(+)
MPSAMHQMKQLLACRACLGCVWRVQTQTDQLQSALKAASQRLIGQANSDGNLSPFRKLAIFLLGFSLTPAFNPSILGVRCLWKSPKLAWPHGVSIDCLRNPCTTTMSTGVDSTVSSAALFPPSRAVTLLVGSRLDPASVVLSNSLMKHDVWKLISDGGDDVVCVHESGQVYLWLQDQRLLDANHINKAFESRCSFPADSVSDVIFLSRHAAKSGNPSLTVHPIGVPWLAEVSGAGGLPGRVSPPSPRIGQLYREMYEKMKTSPLKDEFDVSLEATHHGPHCDVPACFVEIGSTEAEWGREDAGDLWSQVLLNNLVDTESGGSESASNSFFPEQSTVAVVLIGGGHYCPKMCDVARMGHHIYVGHILASYTLTSYFQKKANHTDKGFAQVEGGWQHVVTEAVEGTSRAFPGSKVVVLIDKKAFKASIRNAIADFLSTKGIEHTYKFSLSDYA